MRDGRRNYIMIGSSFVMFIRVSKLVTAVAPAVSPSGEIAKPPETVRFSWIERHFLLT
jgi:hypothetical protein